MAQLLQDEELTQLPHLSGQFLQTPAKSMYLPLPQLLLETTQRFSLRDNPGAHLVQKDPVKEHSLQGYWHCLQLFEVESKNCPEPHCVLEAVHLAP